jgi:hypothetical protein
MYAMGSLIRRYGRGLGACPSADVSALLTKVSYCNIPGVGLTACPGQDLSGIQQYNMQLQTDANNALNQCNCNAAWVLNGSMGVNQCTNMYPVSGQTQVKTPAKLPGVPIPPVSVSSTSLNTQPNSTTGTNAGSTSTNATGQQDTSGVPSIGLTGLEVIIGIIGVGLTFIMMQKGH